MTWATIAEPARRQALLNGRLLDDPAAKLPEEPSRTHNGLPR
jgi:hypothetical protein